MIGLIFLATLGVALLVWGCVANVRKTPSDTTNEVGVGRSTAGLILLVVPLVVMLYNTSITNSTTAARAQLDRDYHTLTQPSEYAVRSVLDFNMELQRKQNVLLARAWYPGRFFNIQPISVNKE